MGHHNTYRVLDEEEDIESEESDEEGGRGENNSGAANKARMSVSDTFNFIPYNCTDLFFHSLLETNHLNSN